MSVLRTGAVSNGQLNLSENKYVEPAQHTKLRTPVRAGTVIFCRKNSEDTIGASALATADKPNVFLSDLLWEIEPSVNVDRDWFAAQFTSERFRQLVRISATGTQSTMKNISQDRLCEVPIAVPPLPEQRKIAEILRTWDEAIETLEAMRAAKEEQYRAHSQRYFGPCHPTSDDRPKDWQEFSLGEVFKERSVAGKDNDRLLSITMNGGVVDRDEVGRKDTSTDDKSKYKLILPGDIGYNTMRMWQGVSGLSTLRGIISPAYTVVTPIEQRILGRYAAHLFKSQRMIFDFQRYSQGLTSDTWNLKFPAFSKINIFLPPTKLQEKQAKLLDALREEALVVGKQIEAISRQKRGLMQKLLTGEWRVGLNSQPDQGESIKVSP